MRSRLLLLLLAPLFAAPTLAQQVRWRTDFTFYSDNTEFFTPYRVGETILGAQFQTYLRLDTGSRSEVRAGVFGDHRFSADSGVDPVKPILAFRYKTDTSTFVFGNLETGGNCHGFLEPLEDPTLAFTRPVEYGLQWLVTRPGLSADVFINWQRLNDEEGREIFDYGTLLRVPVATWLSLGGQLHGLHHGGQLHSVGPVTNNVVMAVGAVASGEIPGLGAASFAAWGLRSKGGADPYQDDEIVRGHGLYLRTSATPAGIAEVFAIWWRGSDFISPEGDHNYGSPGFDGEYYRSSRDYQELGVSKDMALSRDTRLLAQLRLHRIDGTLEYSYRIVVRVPFELTVLQ